MQIGIRWLIPPYVHKRFLRNGFLLRKPSELPHLKTGLDKEKGLAFSSEDRRASPNF
jgi:hypothetical protein